MTAIHKTDLEILADTVPAVTGKVVLMQSPQGAGKTIIARRLAVTVNGPFRAPHHTCSRAAVGAELALAAGGVLYLDDWQEWDYGTLQYLWDVWGRMRPGCQPMVALGWHPHSADYHRRYGKELPPKLVNLVWDRLRKLVDGMPKVDHHLVWGFQ